MSVGNYCNDGDFSIYGVCPNGMWSVECGVFRKPSCPSGLTTT